MKVSMETIANFTGCRKIIWSSITVLSWGKMTKWWHQLIIWCMPPKKGRMFLGKVVPLSWGSSHWWLKAEGCHYQKEVLDSALQNFVHIFFHIFGYFLKKTINVKLSLLPTLVHTIFLFLQKYTPLSEVKPTTSSSSLQRNFFFSPPEQILGWS